MSQEQIEPPPPTDDTQEAVPFHHIKEVILGKPLNLADKSLFHQLSLIPFLAWVGLGADGLSSSSYGPMEAYLALGSHTYLALGLALLTAITVFIIALAYSYIIEDFPHGGGGYLVATKLLGERWGVLSGSALLIDYVLTITISIAAAGDALFSFLPLDWHVGKFTFEVVCILGLTTMNMRGVKESVLALLPVFILFLITHIILIGGGLIVQAPYMADTAVRVQEGFNNGLSTLGIGGMALLFMHAYSLGGGTYTGLEAVSNGMPIMREPRVHTGRMTMLYMSISLAICAGGLLFCYVLWNVSPEEGKTLNAVLTEKLVAGVPFGNSFVITTLLSEAAILVVGAQAGFIDGPRVLANMAVDSWMPHRFTALSDRLTTGNGIILMGAAALLALFYTGGEVSHIVVMYSINVFLTFSLSMFGMAREQWRQRGNKKHWKMRLTVLSIGFLLCIQILGITTVEKFTEGGWITLLATGGVIGLCFLIRHHYRVVRASLDELYQNLGHIPSIADWQAQQLLVDPTKPTAVLMVENYGGLGIHTVLNLFRAFPGHFKNIVFVSVGVLDSGGVKGADTVSDLQESTIAMLEKYVRFASSLEMPATYRFAIGTDVVEEADKLCRQIANEYYGTTFFAGKVVFKRERWYQHLLHNETPYLVQKRLQWAGFTMVILPAKLR